MDLEKAFKPTSLVDKQETYDSYTSFMILADKERANRRNYILPEGGNSLPDYDVLEFTIDGVEQRVQINPDRVGLFKSQYEQMFGERVKWK